MPLVCPLEVVWKSAAFYPFKLHTSVPEQRETDTQSVSRSSRLGLSAPFKGKLLKWQLITHPTSLFWFYWLVWEFRAQCPDRKAPLWHYGAVKEPLWSPQMGVKTQGETREEKFGDVDHRALIADVARKAKQSAVSGSKFTSYFTLITACSIVLLCLLFCLKSRTCTWETQRCGAQRLSGTVRWNASPTPAGLLCCQNSAVFSLRRPPFDPAVDAPSRIARMGKKRDEKKKRITCTNKSSCPSLGCRQSSFYVVFLGLFCGFEVSEVIGGHLMVKTFLSLVCKLNGWKFHSMMFLCIFRVEMWTKSVQLKAALPLVGFSWSRRAI